MKHVAAVFGFGWNYLRPYWARLVCGIVCGVMFGVATGSFIPATRMLAERFDPAPVQAVERAQPTSPLKVWAQNLAAAFQEAIDPWLPRAGRPQDWKQIAGVLLFLPLLMALRGAADFLSNYCLSWVSERAVRDLRLAVLEKLSSLSLDFFTRARSGDLLTRINTDSQNLLLALRAGGLRIVSETATVFAAFGYLLWMDWRLTLLTLVLMPVCFYPLAVLGRKARRAMKAGMEANVAQASQMVEWINGIRVIKAYGLEARELARFRESSQDLLRAGMKGTQAREMITPVIEVASMAAFGCLMLYFFGTGGSGAGLASFLLGLVLFFYPIKRLAAIHIVFEQASVAVVRLMEILNEKPRVTEPARPKPLPGFQAEIVFENVTFAYEERAVLKDFTLRIPRGFKLGVAGESGSGKTTLVNLLFRFYDPTGGGIRIDGLNLREIATADLRRQFALVSQDVVIFDQTVAENIASGRAGANLEAVQAAARAAHADEFIRQLPQGYETRVGERGATLSGGQRQRIAIARAFVRNAPILVLDEATASLDSKTEAEVQAAIDRLTENRTVICVAHRLSTLARMDQIIVLRDGRIVESGRYEDLLKAGGPFAAMAAKQGILPVES